MAHAERNTSIEAPVRMCAGYGFQVEFVKRASCIDADVKQSSHLCGNSCQMHMEALRRGLIRREDNQGLCIASRYQADLLMLILTL